MGGPRGAIIRRTGYLCDRIAGGQGWPGAYNRGQRQRALSDGGLTGGGSPSHRGPGYREDAGPLLALALAVAIDPSLRVNDNLRSAGLLPTSERADEDRLAGLDVGLQPGDQSGGRSNCASDSTLGIARKYGLNGEYRQLGLRGLHRHRDTGRRHHLGQSSSVTATRLPRFVRK